MINVYSVENITGNTKIYCRKREEDIVVYKGNSMFYVKKEVIDTILNDFFIDQDKWYLLGSCIQSENLCLGEYLKRNIPSIKPNHVPAIVGIMIHEGIISYRSITPRKIELKKSIQ